MYLPPAFAQTSHDQLLPFMRRHAFATVVGTLDAEPLIEHLPLLVDAEGGQVRLRGHTAIGNRLTTSPAATAVFAGPHGYISAGWYETPDTVPTWNYQVAHARGPLRVLTRREERLQVLTDLAQRFEGEAAERWQQRLTESVRDRLLAAITCFEIRVEELIGTWKLSQNHPRERIERVIAALTASGRAEDQALAEAMRAANGL